MSRPARRVVAKAVSLIFLIGLAGPARAQGPGAYNRVLSTVEDSASSLVLLNTTRTAPIAPPTIQYLPGGEGETIMVADFAGLIWGANPKLLRPSSSGIRQIHIGQFQSNPPIVRIAISSSQPTLLRAVAFRASPGLLVIKWEASPPPNAHKSDASTAAAQRRNPALSPALARQGAPPEALPVRSLPAPSPLPVPAIKLVPPQAPPATVGAASGALWPPMVSRSMR